MLTDDKIELLHAIYIRHKGDFEKTRESHIKVSLDYIYKTLNINAHIFKIKSLEINKEHGQIFFTGRRKGGEEFVNVDFVKLDMVLSELKAEQSKEEQTNIYKQSKHYMQIFTIGISILALVFSGYAIFIKPNSNDAKIELLQNQIVEIQKQLSNK